MVKVLHFIEKLTRPIVLAKKLSPQKVSRIKGLHNYFVKILEEFNSELDPQVRDFFNHIIAEVRGVDELEGEGKYKKILNFLEAVLEYRGKILRKAYEESERELFKDVKFIKGVGPRVAEYFYKKGIRTVRDLLFFTPRRFEDRREVTPISKLEPGKVQVAAGVVEMAEEYRAGTRRIFEVIIRDATGFLSLKWFNFRRGYMRKTFQRGVPVVVCGEVKIYRRRKEMVHPEVELGTPGSATTGFVPLYPEIEGVYGKQLRKIITRAVEDYSDYVVSVVPVEVEKSLEMMPLSDAVKALHSPDKFSSGTKTPEEVFREARRRVLFEDLFVLEVGMALRKEQILREEGTPLNPEIPLVEKFLSRLPFSLTGAQKRVMREIKHDLSRPRPMNRLLQGDVGSGKTVVAVYATAIAVGNGYQVAVMAPTEILAEQHFHTFSSFLAPLGVNICLLTSSLSRTEKARYLRLIRSGVVNVVIGTHAVIQESVEFKSLVLGIIDEQHRFGVIQRALLRKKGLSPHILVMTATPIPRTLAMTLYGDLDLSVIDEMPPGRKPVVTKVYSERERGTPYTFLKRLVEKGLQGYVVLPAVEETEKVDLRSAVETYEKLKGGMFAEFNVGLVHGRMKAEERQEVMRKFKNGEIHILVATTVIEVGIDVPNAGVMIVENAERFGLSQLHQLRGRIGRGTAQSYMFLIYSRNISDKGLKRLKIMESETDGFKIAEHDLEMRGPGEIFGTKQWGIPDNKMTEMLADPKLLSRAREEAFKVVRGEYPLSEVEKEVLFRNVMMAWGEKLELAQTG